jgi:hypothetical protein
MLGGKVYEVKTLVIKDSREWRKKFAAMIADLPKYANVKTDDPSGFTAAADQMLTVMPDKVIDLVFDYAKNLNRAKIEAKATDKELALAFQQIVVVAFPLVGSLTGAITKIQL